MSKDYFMFALESVAQVLEEIKPLLHAHWQEIAPFKGKVELAPDYQSYVALEACGKLQIATVREEGRLIGYCVSLIQRGIDYSKNISAIHRLFYVDEEHRTDSLGAVELDMIAGDLLRFAEKELKLKGVSVISVHIKVWKDWSALAEQHGYTRSEYVHQKYVGD